MLGAAIPFSHLQSVRHWKDQTMEQTFWNIT